MKIQHLPGIGIKINGNLINWGTPRILVREVLGGRYKEMNSIISLMDIDSEEGDLIVRKDVYRDYLGSTTWFTIIYSKADQFEEFEFHDGDALLIDEGIILKFGENIFEVLDSLNADGVSIIKMDEEYILLTELKTSFSSANHMGGDGQDLDYIYCSKSIKHLICL